MLKEVANFNKLFTQKCKVDEPWCEGFFVWRRDFVDYGHYAVSVSLPDPAVYLRFGERQSSTTLFDMEAKVHAFKLGPEMGNEGKGRP